MASKIIDLGSTQIPGNGIVFKDINPSYDTVGYAGYGFDDLTDTMAIKSAIHNILSFRQGQRILLPDFGNTLYRFLYKPINKDVSSIISSEVRDMITKWEPRISITHVKVISNIQDRSFTIRVDYHINALDDGVTSGLEHTLL